MAEGIDKRHKRACRSRDGGRCNCTPAYQATVFDARTGKRTRKNFPSETAAKGWRRDAYTAIRRGEFGPTREQRQTLSAAAEQWYEAAKAGVALTRRNHPYKPAALRAYRKILDAQLLPEIGDRSLSAIRRSDVQALIDKWTRKGYAATSVANYLSPLRAIYRYALARELIDKAPFDLLAVPSARTRRDRVASAVEAATLLAALSGDVRAIYGTAFYAGLRRGELRGLRWSDVDLEARRIEVRRSWDDEVGEIPPKSEAGFRTIPVLEPLRPILLEHKLRSGGRDDDLVFGRTATEPFNPRTINVWADDTWDAAKLDRISLHSCRHTFASLMIDANVNLKTIQTCMGHGSISVTLDVYGHLLPSGLDDLCAKADAYLAAAT